MRKGTKIALAAGALAVAGAAGLSSLAVAEYHGSHDGGYHGKSHHGKGHHGWRHRGGKSAWRMHYLMARFDTNEDGKLTQEEIDEARKTLLAKHDTDKDGKLSLAEYQNLWLEVKRRKMVRSFQRTDVDGDAVVTVDEFLKPYSKIVERLDRNDDEALDEDDRGRRHRHHDRDDDGDRGKKRDD